ncbi:MAG: hypothetical protein Q8L00_02875 [Deltaproteobacteria bacterium]|nr:hypothetical protein [Deltaproteobacteria bacterium]
MSAQLKDLTRMNQPSPARSAMVKVSYGVHNLEAAIAGKSVSEVRQSLREPLNIDPRALALVNSRDVAASYILKQGDQLEFVRLAGEKGGGRVGGATNDLRVKAHNPAAGRQVHSGRNPAKAS